MEYSSHPLEQSWTQLLRKDARGGGEPRRRSWWPRRDAPAPSNAQEEPHQSQNKSADTRSVATDAIRLLPHPASEPHIVRRIAKSDGGYFPSNMKKLSIDDPRDLLQESSPVAKAKRDAEPSSSPPTAARAKRAGEASRSADSSDTLSEQRTSPFLREGKRYLLPVLLQGHDVTALPDSGSDIEAIDLALARKLKLKINTSEATTVTLGNGDTLRSMGSVSLWTVFARGEPMGSERKFHVFSKLATGVQAILGCRFLDETRTMSEHRERLVEREYNFGGIPKCMNISTGTRRLPCYIDNMKVLATADTGSDISLINGEYARQRGLHIQPVSMHERWLELPGDYLAEVLGKVSLKFDTLHAPKVSEVTLPASGKLTLSDRDPVQEQLSRNRTIGDHHRTFYVLESLTCNVLLGEELLDSIDAFGSHADSFVDVDVGDSESIDVRSIKWATRLEQRLLKLMNRGPAVSRDSESFTTQERRAVAEFLQIDDISHVGTESKFREALSLRDAQESSRQRDMDALLDDRTTKEQKSTDAAIKLGLWAEIRDLQTNEAQARSTFERDRLHCKMAWCVWYARNQQAQRAHPP